MRILRMPAVIERTGLSRSTIWRRLQRGEFPERRALGGGLVGWLEEDIDRFIEGLPVVGNGVESGEQKGASASPARRSDP